MKPDALDRLIELRDRMQKQRDLGLIENPMDIQVLTDAIKEIQRLRENQRYP